MDDRSRDPFILTIGGTKDARASLRIVDHKFVIGKEEFLPYVAEMHYFRVAKRHWSICFERIRKANFRIISTVVPWNLHESKQGEFDFSGSTDPAKDLVVFLELCREFGFKIVLRPGPWVGSEWDNGGLPDFAVRHPETLATDKSGQTLLMDPGAGAKQVALPSYLSNRYQILLKNYFSVFGEVVKNYIYPRGPVFMIELDHETSFGGHFNPLSSDYNLAGTRAQFEQFLTEKYETVDRLNKLWKSRHKGFSEAAPPETLDAKGAPEFCRLRDWVEFREWAINRYTEYLTEVLSQTEVSVLFARSLAFDRSYYFPDVAGAQTAGRVLFTVNLGWDRPFAETVLHARSVSGWQSTGFCTQLTIGSHHADPGAGHAFWPVTAADSKRLLVASLAAGLKGFNYHMFVGRQRWYDGALEADGAINPSYDVVRLANEHLTNLKYETMRDFADVALVRYRPYLRAAAIGDGHPHGYLTELTGPDFEDLAADLLALGYDYRVFDLTVPERLDRYGTIIVPLGEFMDAEAQETLAKLVKSGAHLIAYGAIPKFDNNLDPCEKLAKAIGFRTAFEPGRAIAEARHATFPVRSWGTIRKSPTRAVKLAKAGARILAATSKCGKGHVTVVTMSPGSRLLPAKLAFLQEILKVGALQTPVFCSDPSVHVVLHAHAKAGLLMVYDSAEGSGRPDSRSQSLRSLIIGADLSFTPLAATKVALSDVLGSEIHRVTVKDLKAGIEIRLGRGDSRLFSIEKK